MTDPQHFASNLDDMRRHNLEFAEGFTDGDLPTPPSKRLCVVACMDSRMDIFALLGLENGEAHIIRNAGGVVTDDVIRSLCVSQRALGTREIVLLHHTDCGLQLVSEDSFKAEIESEIGIKPWWALESFLDPYADVRQSIQRLLRTPFITHKEHISGFVYDTSTGLIHEVAVDGAS